MRGGGQRAFGIFPKIHPFWYRHPSLRLPYFVCLTLAKRRRGDVSTINQGPSTQSEGSGPGKVVTTKSNEIIVN